MVKAVIFDCFGVLTTGTWKAFIDGLPGTADIGAARALNRAYDAGIIDKHDFLTGVMEATGQKPDEVESLLADDIVKNTPLLDYIRELRGRGYKIGLLSNIATNWIRDSLLTPEEQTLFDDMVMSFEVGMTKPDPRLYQLVCDRLGVEPAEAVLVDDIDYYCQAARDEGMQAVVFTSLSQMKPKLEQILNKKV